MSTWIGSLLVYVHQNQSIISHFHHYSNGNYGILYNYYYELLFLTSLSTPTCEGCGCASFCSNISMDSSPTITELLEHVQLPSNTKINKLAKHLGISVEYNIKGKDRLETVFRRWIAEAGNEATRRNVVESLTAIKEHEAATIYQKHIESIEECKSVYSKKYTAI